MTTRMGMSEFGAVMLGPAPPMFNLMRNPKIERRRAQQARVQEALSLSG
jgi:hypothetical protein